MSVLNQSGEEQVECPLCMEPLEVDDLHFYPCTCGYQICRFCWNRIREGENGLCPACRKAYPENPADFTPLSQEQVAAIKTEKKAREQKRRNKTLESRRALANVRVVQNNLVFVVGLPVRLADPEILKRQEYFGKYGKIHKVVINQSTAYAGSQGPSASAYVTYVSPSDALRAIQGVNNVPLDGRVLKGSLGTTKYCAHFMKNQPCPKPDCMYLHDLGDPKASFTKEEMHAGLHQVYERKLHQQLIARDEKMAAAATAAAAAAPQGNSSTNPEKGSSKDGTQSNFIPTTVVTSSHIHVVNSSRSKKEPSTAGDSSSSSSSGKEAWPSLGSSPPAHSPPRKLSPAPAHPSNPASREEEEEDDEDIQYHVKSQDSGPSEASPPRSPARPPSPPADPEPPTDPEPPSESQSPADPQNFLNTELDELESDRHSLLENHDLLDNSDHSLLEDNTHNLLNDANSESLIMQRHREMLAGLVDSNHLQHVVKGMNGFGFDREAYERQGMMEQKDMILRERRDMMLREREMLVRQAMMEQKHYMPPSSISLESTSDLLGSNYYPNHNMLPFGMRVDNSMTNMNNMATNSLSANNLNPLTNSMASNHLTNSMSVNSLGNSMTMNSMSGMPFLMHTQQMLNQQHMQSVPNGFEGSHPSSEGRYVSENMDKFFTDFNKAQQLRQQARPPAPYPHNMLRLERLEMEHKQRMGTAGMAAGGDGDDDLDFDPFKETQKALAEMMETEMMQSTGDSMERVRRARMAPPGFGAPAASLASPASPALAPPPFLRQPHGNTAPMVSDWTQMDPAIMSTSVSFKPPTPAQAPPAQSAPPAHTQHNQHDLFARFNHLALHQINGTKTGNVGTSNSTNLWAGPLPSGHKLWAAGARLPPGFAPPQPGHGPLHAQECIDAK